MRLRKIFILFLFCSHYGLYATYPDSLLVKQLTDSLYGMVNNGEYEQAAKKALLLSQQFASKGNKKAEGNFLRIYGYTIERRGNIDSAISVYSKALDIAEETKDHRLTGAINHSIGTAYYYYGKYDKALEYLLKARKIRAQIKDSLGLAWSLNNSGLIYWQQQSLDEGLYHFTEANKLFNKLNNSTNPTIALESKKGSAISYNNIGLMYENKRNYVEAKKYYLLSLKLNRIINNPDGIGLALNNLGASFHAEGNNDSALKYYNESLVIHEQINDLEGIGLCYSNIAECYSSKNDINRALQYEAKSVDAYQKGNIALGLKRSYSILASLHAKTKNYKAAYEYQVKYSTLSDSLSYGNKLAEMQSQFDREKHENELTMIEKDKLVAEEKIKKDRIIIWSAAAVGLLLLVVATMSLISYRRKKNDNQILADQNFQINKQKEIIEEKQKDITDSIVYARRIQQAILPLESELRQHFPESLIFFRPRDIVSGDFYWLHKTQQTFVLALGDCTGHGVPGAFMSIIGHNLLTQAVLEEKAENPAEILSLIDSGLKSQLNKTTGGAETSMRDGMDMAICTFAGGGNKLTFSGANRPLIHISNGILTEHKANKLSIGGDNFKTAKQFTQEEVTLSKGDMIYIFSDGYADQFGGATAGVKNFKNKRLLVLLLSISNLSALEQKKKLEENFESWRGNLEQLDDVSMIAIRV